MRVLEVDFNSSLADGAVLLFPSRKPPEGATVGLREGQPVVLSDPGDDELIEVDAILTFRADLQEWVAVPQWETQRRRPR